MTRAAPPFHPRSYFDCGIKKPRALSEAAASVTGVVCAEMFAAVTAGFFRVKSQPGARLYSGRQRIARLRIASMIAHAIDDL